MFVSFLIGIFVFIFGLCIGSFLNCVIYRLESKKSLRGRSFCPHCKHILGWQDLFPVFSFLFLKGRCRHCHEEISIQYPLVELATGIIFLLVFWKFGLGNIIALCFMFYVSCSMILIFVYDLKHYIVPDRILLPAVAILFFFRILEFGISAPLLNYILAAVVGSGFFLIIFLVSRGAAMGFGDVKLALLMGFLLGTSNVLLALFLAFFFGAIIGVILMAFRKKSLKSEIPFGPFLIVGTFLALLWGQQLVSWYFNLFLA